MRINTPVTHLEYVLRDGESIVSTTDLQGNITYANAYFIEVSGYSEAELLGSPQNILRHPDMPAEAFADLWATIKNGAPWTGMVKNRCKNGDFYWVLANVTPVIENGKPVGYMSVRTKPTREQINKSGKIYQEIRDGNPNRLEIRHGAARKTGLLAKLAAIRHISLAKRTALSLGFTALTSLLLAIAAFSPAFASSAGLQRSIAALALLSTAVTMHFWFYLYQAVIEPIKDATRITRTLAGGDLTASINTERHDDVGRLLRSMHQLNVNLHSIIGDVRKNFAHISVATKELAAGNMDLSDRTESEASALEETASSMEELAATVEQNTDNAVQANALAKNASVIAEKGGAIVSGVVSTINEISSSSKKIVDIIGIIDSIAFQTNILALNAAVEAARAGEQGRGFAVVATEVRNLAQRSAAAAKEITQLIKVSVEKVDAGTVLAEQAGKSMGDIISSIRQVSDIMDEISSASREQSDGISQVNTAVTQLDEVTQQNAALVEQAAAATASLEEQTIRLTQALVVFKLKTDTPANPRAKPAARPGPKPAPAQVAVASRLQAIGHS